MSTLRCVSLTNQIFRKPPSHELLMLAQTAFLPPTPVTQNQFRAETKCAKCQRVQPVSCSKRGDSDTQKRPRRAMSPEARAKISAALKGRRKSEEHRENLRRRFGGNQNPMYGRKLSAESRAKISRAMVARNQKKAGEVQNKEVDQETLDGLREKAKSSRLFESTKEKPKRPGRRLIDEREAKEIDKILQRVARLDEPPESVVKMIKNTEKTREDKLSQQIDVDRDATTEGRMKCGGCKGSGMTACPECVGAFGVASERCETCFGAGSTFCPRCEGAGTVATE